MPTSRSHRRSSTSSGALRVQRRPAVPLHGPSRPAGTSQSRHGPLTPPSRNAHNRSSHSSPRNSTRADWPEMQSSSPIAECSKLLLKGSVVAVRKSAPPCQTVGGTPTPNLEPQQIEELGHRSRGVRLTSRFRNSNRTGLTGTARGGAAQGRDRMSREGSLLGRAGWSFWAQVRHPRPRAWSSAEPSIGSGHPPSMLQLPQPSQVRPSALAVERAAVNMARRVRANTSACR